MGGGGGGGGWGVWCCGLYTTIGPETFLLDVGNDGTYIDWPDEVQLHIKSVVFAIWYKCILK